MKIESAKHIHFIGIGGIGISAIAQMFLTQGKKVSGSDSSESEITKELSNRGAHIYSGHKNENINSNVDLVIYTIAVKPDNEELSEAQNRGIPCISYPEALGIISNDKITIAVSGTHGKTTTTAMTAHLMIKNHLDPTVIVGSKMTDSKTNFIAGKSNYLVVEACEYRRSFLNLNPTYLIITNIEEDHLDYYRDLHDIKDAFLELATRIPEHGAIVADSKIKKWLDSCKLKAPIHDYEELEIESPLLVPGEHNESNAKAAIKTVGLLEQIQTLDLSDFKGTWRRLEYKGSKNNFIFYDDYAHHPTEIKASLAALKQTYPDNKIVCVFEPHQQSRTKILLDGFVESLSMADYAFIAPILCVRENFDPSITNTLLSEAINHSKESKPVNSTDELTAYLNQLDHSHKYCVVLMGAGSIYKWTEIILK